MRWSDLEPDQRIVAALDHADAERGARARLIASGTAAQKNNWSNSFADACARMLSRGVAAHDFAKNLVVRPDPDSRAEPPTITYWERGQRKAKKVDVLVGDLIAGLQIAVSLKGVGFRDRQSLGYSKNVTGRLYELENETRRLHEYRPQALVVAMYFVPMAATLDKRTDRTPSGFADIATHLRRLCGRGDEHRQDEWHRVDRGFVALYVPGDAERFVMRGSGAVFEYADRLPRGVIRYFDVTGDAPRRARPLVSETLALEGVVESIVRAASGPAPEDYRWGIAESED